MLMPTELRDGRFVPILTTSEMLKRKTTLAIPKYMFMSTLQHAAEGKLLYADRGTGGSREMF